MLVSRSNFKSAVEHIASKDYLSLDCETTTLSPYNGGQLFLICIRCDDERFTFNFYDGKDHLGGSVDKQYVLDLSQVGSLIRNPSTIFIHNAKFDLHFLKSAGLDLTPNKFTIHCTAAIGRVCRNDRKKYDLNILGTEIGFPKMGDVSTYISKHKLYSWQTFPGKKKRSKQKYFYLVPMDILVPYVERDAEVAFALGMHQIEFIRKNESLKKVFKQERQLTKVLLQMEEHGVHMDKNYTESALLYERQNLTRHKENFRKLSGEEFVPSTKVFHKVFTNAGELIYTTAKGNPSFTDDILDRYKSPIAQEVRDVREADKKAGTYYGSFLSLMDKNNIIHTNFKQYGAATGRFSCTEPNLQNIPKPDEDKVDTSKFQVRGCFTPRPDYSFVMIDYNQMEYRLMLDYANEVSLIKKVMDGMDVHVATAEALSVLRKEAKTINFMLLYGGGIDALAAALGVTTHEAYLKRERYFRVLTNVQKFIREVIQRARARGYVFNWLGRRCYIDNHHTYKAPNYIIQGGCADIVKQGMLRLAEFLENKRSRMVLQVHDEIIFEVHKNEMDIVPNLKKIMEDVYKPMNGMFLTCGVDYSTTSWKDKEPYDIQQMQSVL